jgi:hypothetical protein
VDNLIPIFDKYPLLTHKQLDYRDWKKAIWLKLVGQKITRSLSIEILEKINEIKNGMNSFRTNSEGYILTNEMVTKNWKSNLGSKNSAQIRAQISETQKSIIKIRIENKLACCWLWESDLVGSNPTCPIVI